MKSRVFVPYRVTVMGVHGIRDKFSMDFLAEYGEACFIFDGPAVIANPNAAVKAAERVLRCEKFNVENDYLLSAGDPCALVQITEAIRNLFEARPRILRWDKGNRGYDILAAKHY